MKIIEVQYEVPPEPRDKTFALVRFQQAFYQEVLHRQAHQRYCQWYRTVAAQHQAELHRMRQDVNLLGWFRR